MAHLLFKWALSGERYVFTGLATTSRGQVPEVDTELVAIWSWLQKWKVRTGEFDWTATRRTVTSKEEVLAVEKGALVADGSTVLHPVETRLVLSLPEKVAVQFRFEFNVVDDRR